MKKKNKNKIVGYGWSGRWIDGQIGWFISPHVDGYFHAIFPPASNDNCKGEPCYKVKITVEVVKDRRGKEIIRKFRGEGK